tara:strand:+ start:766 stop:1689 length:924 start_codon:yes stop_codon:yes gene_type:complete
MDIIELFIDEEDEVSGIEAISVVANGAIESDFIALKNQEFKLAEVDKEKRILMGAALIPNKPIYRQSGEQEYYIFFSKATVRKASELFFIKGNQNNATLEHQLELKGLTAVESWIVESEQDKSRMYDLNVPIGTWMVSMKVNNDDVWKKVKAGEVKGFSIEGFFADKLERSNEPVKESKMSKEEVAEAKIEELRQLFSTEKVDLNIAKKTRSLMSKPVEKIFNNSEKLIEELENNQKRIQRQIQSTEAAWKKSEKIYIDAENKIRKAAGDLGIAPFDIDGFERLNQWYNYLDDKKRDLVQNLKKHLK